LIGEGKREAGAISLDYSFDGFELDTIRFPHKTDRKFIFDIDELVSKEAAKYIEKESPDLSWVYLEFTDDVGHMYGDGPAMDDAVKKADVQIGRIWESVKKREAMGEEWMMVVTTDHGRSPRNGRNHGCQTDRERITWICTNIENLNKSYHQNPGEMDIMPSILSHLEIIPPVEIRNEIDGVSFIGEVSFNQLRAHHDRGNLIIEWNSLDTKGEIEIWISTTNNFKLGKDDEYKLLSRNPISSGIATIPFDLTSDFYKILLKAPNNRCNTWLIQ
jgi:hypothetical protein